jgi:threonine dehydrogenase-like Zn-dependent dehydrogenase
MQQIHIHKRTEAVVRRIQKGEMDPSFVITHELNLDNASYGHEIFRAKEDKCIKVVMKP